MRRAPWLLALLGLATCVDPPALKTCDEFPLATEGCGEPCAVYCDLMVEACPQVLSGQDKRAACQATCIERQLPNGTFGDAKGDTLACRITFAQAGRCEEAGLEAGDQCAGATCDAYCDDMMAHCAGAYPEKDTCLAACGVMPHEPTDATVEANSLACRARFAREAAQAPGGEACDKASLGSDGTCGDPCEAPRRGPCWRNCATR